MVQSAVQSALQRAARSAVLRPPVLQAGFRIFFLLGSGYVLAALVAWLLTFSGVLPVPGRWQGPLLHGHEMIFGFVGAAMAGFLLTAVPTWTDSERVGPPALATLACIWAIGRIGIWAADVVPAALGALFDLAFLPALALLVGRSIVRAGSWRNLPILAILALLVAANLAVHLELMGVGRAARTGVRAAVYLAIALAAIISGRIVPAFTRSALERVGEEPHVHSRMGVERSTAVAVLLAAFLDVTNADPLLVGLSALLVATFLLLRQSQWRPLATGGQPILWILHVGHAFIALGFACVGAAALLPGRFPATTAFHVFTSGAIATLVVAVMSRVALGHTGRELVAPPAVVAAYVLVPLGALVRVLAPMAFPAAYLETVIVAGAVWGAGFVCLCAGIWPVLLRPRVDGRPG